MTIGILSAIAVLLLWPAGGIAAGFALVAAQCLILELSPVPPGVSAQILLLAFVLAAPLAARLASLLLESAVLPESAREIFGGATLTLVLALVFGSDMFADYLGMVLLSTAKSGTTSLVVLALSLANSLVFCAALTAFTMLTINLLIEAPLAWLASAARVRSVAPFAPFRPLIVLIGVSLSFQLLIGLFDSTLSPGAVMKMHAGKGAPP
jgi:hypothetical protein